MRRFIQLIIFAQSIILSAQETLPIYQQYLLRGKFWINPAYYGATDSVEFDANYHRQFSKFDTSPNVQSIGIHANIVDRMGTGISLFRDQNGAISSNGISVGASYFVPITDDGRRNQFSFGANVNFYNASIDHSRINAKDSDDPLLSIGVNSIFNTYTNLGLQATYEGFFGGVSILDIPLSDERLIINGIEPSPTKYVMNAGYDYEITEGFSVEPSLLLNLNTNSARLMDINILAKIYDDDNSLIGGVSFRSAKDKNIANQLSISPLVQVKVNSWHFGVSYHISMGKIAPYGGNSFMLSLGYSLDNFINPRGFRIR